MLSQRIDLWLKFIDSSSEILVLRHILTQPSQSTMGRIRKQWEYVGETSHTVRAAITEDRKAIKVSSNKPVSATP